MFDFSKFFLRGRRAAAGEWAGAYTQATFRFREIAAVALLPRNDNTISVYARF